MGTLGIFRSQASRDAKSRHILAGQGLSPEADIDPLGQARRRRRLRAISQALYDNAGL
jgi:hypothetical protein